MFNFPTTATVSFLYVMEMAPPQRLRCLLVSYPKPNEMIKPSDATPITKVASHPTARERRDMVNFPMTVGFVAICMRSTIIGAAAIAFKTADQTRALIGLTLRAFATAPNNVATAMVP
jgi:hypothetical protein